jgi:Calcium-activated chloride channel
LSEEYKAFLADFLEYRAYSIINPNTVQYQKEEAKGYERFKPIDNINLFMHLFEQEIDIDRFEKEGFVMDHFPLHQYRSKKEVTTSWYRHLFGLFKSCIFSGDDLRDYAGLTAFGFYHGPEAGFFMGFLTVYTAWMICLAIP